MKQIVFFTTLYLAFSQETLLKEKVGICLHFLNLKITKDEQGFKKIFESVPHESADLIMNKVIGEMLLNCVENVDDSLALDLDRTRSQQWFPEYNELLAFDPNNLYVDVELTSQQIDIMQEAMKQTQELYANQHPERFEPGNNDAKKEKLAACLVITRFKMTEQDEIIHDIISTLPKELEERAINKVVGDMLVNCMDRITSQSAFELMQLGEYAELRPEHHQLLEWDRNQFKTGKEIQFNQRHMEIFEEVMQAQKVAQQAYEEKMMENLEHHQALQTHDAEEVMSYAWILIVAVFIFIVGFCYYSAGTKKPEKKPEVLQKNIKKNSNKKKE